MGKRRCRCNGYVNEMNVNRRKCQCKCLGCKELTGCEYWNDLAKCKDCH